MTLRTLLALLALSLLTQCSTSQHNETMHKHSNELIHSSSPYLLQHAHNPVDWHEWTEDNLIKAKELGKPLIISIGYSSCHWCHVMEHESFEDEEVAEYMNKHFYCIKVDREERPDVDQIYMTAANIITGRGGWPLNCFAMPDGRPFHAGTYFKRNDWLSLLQSVNKQFTENRDKIESYANRLTQGIRLQETAISDNTASPLQAATLVSATETWMSKFDSIDGGFAGAPKFPMPTNFMYLLKYEQHYPSEKLKKHIHLSLNKMAQGGIYDQIGGGFARYSVDPYWKVPHFEKMLYDNAQLMELFAMAYKKTPTDEYRYLIEQTFAWLIREMQDKSGLFYSALDADSEGEEGKFYIWTKEELRSVLGNHYELAERLYNINNKGHWEKGQYILLRDKSIEQLSIELNIPIDELRAKQSEIHHKLMKVRDQRTKPGLDDKCLTSWNALLISGLAEAYEALGDERYLNTAIDIAEAIDDHLVKDGELQHSYKDGVSHIDPMLEDLSFLSKAYLDLYSIIGNEEYLIKGKQLLDQMLSDFYHSEKGLFYFNKKNELIVQSVDLYDNVTPSTNAMSAYLLHRYGLIEGNTAWLQTSEELVSKAMANSNGSIAGFSFWAMVHLEMSMPFFELVITGKNAKEEALGFNQRSLYNLMVVHAEKEEHAPIFEGRIDQDTTTFYLCQKGVCQLPQRSAEAITELLNSQ